MRSNYRTQQNFYFYSGFFNLIFKVQVTDDVLKSLKNTQMLFKLTISCNFLGEKIGRFSEIK